MYRKCVAIVVFDPISKLCLVGKRSGNQYLPHQGWQFPQGGVDDGESHACAAKRELFEEMGIRGCSVDLKESVSVNVCCVANIKHAVANYDFATNYDQYLPSVQFVKNSGPYLYDYPKHVEFKEKGQEQMWFLAHKTREFKIILGSEFVKYAWMEPAVILQNIVDFKKAVYANALKDLRLL